MKTTTILNPSLGNPAIATPGDTFEIIIKGEIPRYFNLDDPSSGMSFRLPVTWTGSSHRGVTKTTVKVGPELPAWIKQTNKEPYHLFNLRSRYHTNLLSVCVRSEPVTKPYIFWHITDVHLHSKSKDRYDALRTICQHANPQEVDFIICTGDIVDYVIMDGLDDLYDGNQIHKYGYVQTNWWTLEKCLMDYEAKDLDKRMPLRAPLFLVLGNHDYRYYSHRTINLARSPLEWGTRLMHLYNDYFNYYQDYSFTFGGDRFYLLDTGPDRDWARTWDGLSDALQGSPDSIGFRPRQVNYVKRYPQDRSLFVFAHAPLINTWLLNLDYPKSFECQMIDKGVAHNNRLDMAKRLFGQQAAAYFSGHTHHTLNHLLRREKRKIVVDNLPPKGGGIYHLQTPQLWSKGKVLVREIKVVNGQLDSVNIWPIGG